eukprot:gene7818-biopygen5078
MIITFAATLFPRTRCAESYRALDTRYGAGRWIGPCSKLDTGCNTDHRRRDRHRYCVPAAATFKVRHPAAAAVLVAASATGYNSGFRTGGKGICQGNVSRLVIPSSP